MRAKTCPRQEIISLRSGPINIEYAGQITPTTQQNWRVIWRTRVKTWLSMFLIFMSLVKNDACACSFCNSGGGGVEDQNMAKSLTTQPFNAPSQAVLELIEPSDKVAWLSEARYSYETKLRELKHQFESKAADLREEYLSIMLQIHKLPER